MAVVNERICLCFCPFRAIQSPPYQHLIAVLVTSMPIRVIPISIQQQWMGVYIRAMYEHIIVSIVRTIPEQITTYELITVVCTIPSVRAYHFTSIRAPHLTFVRATPASNEWVSIATVVRTYTSNVVRVFYHSRNWARSIEGNIGCISAKGKKTYVHKETGIQGTKDIGT